MRSAQQWQRRPSAAIMRDDWYGHRDLFTGEEVGDKDEWLEVDYALLTALQTLEDYTDQNGLLVWEVQDHLHRVHVHADRKIDQFEAAKTIATSGKNYKAPPGEYFIPKLELRADEWPTMEEFIEHQIEVAEEEEREKTEGDPLAYQNL